MADTIRDRYQRAMASASPDAATMLARAMQGKPQPGGGSPFLGPHAQAALPGYQRPYAGLQNNMNLPAFEAPGASLPMDRYMPQPAATQAPLPQSAPMSPPQMTAPAEQPAIMPMSTEPVPQNLGDPAVAALAEAMRKKVSPWAVNEGSFRDQYGG